MQDETYIGTLVQGKQGTPHYKIKQMEQRPSSEWIRVPDAHEPLIAKQDFELVQRIRRLDTRTSPKQDIRVLKEKLADVLENRSERNRWISHFTQFSTMETLDRKAVVHMIQSIKVIGKKELEITFTYQDEYQKAIQLIQLAEQTSQRKVG